MSTERTDRSSHQWRFWGPYLSERQWGTVREDYSADGSAWGYLPHDAARSRAYRWGEDGLGGFSDSKSRLCFCLGLWNGNDPILKERLFGLGGPEGNHAEDVKELYYYLDATPSHSYLKMLYKYPHAAFPYDNLVAENRRRGKKDPEYEIQDTGVFKNGEYWDVFIEYAKASPLDVLIRIRVINRGPKSVKLHLVPQLWFRNTWSWDPGKPKPKMSLEDSSCVVAAHHKLGEYALHFEDGFKPLFCDNETNMQKIFGTTVEGAYPKDALHEYVVHGSKKAVNPTATGTKVGLCKIFETPPNTAVDIKLRLVHNSLGPSLPFEDFDETFARRIKEADEFYKELQDGIDSEDAQLVSRQAFAGMIWSKQYYHYDLRRWLIGDTGSPPPPAERKQRRNAQWLHLYCSDIISMPDKWEYPWYAAWDLAFHCIPLALLDAEFAKEQLLLLLREWYMHPNGQLPAYEWAFGDVNPPVHAWAAWRVYKIEKRMKQGVGDIDFLEKIFHKLCLNFTWWVNRKDEAGHNIFQGGFLGLDNIGVFDRSSKLPTGGHIEQADGTAWMAMYALNLMHMALELSLERPVYQAMATKFLEHFLLIAEAMMGIGKDGRSGIKLWHEEDEFYYDVLHVPDCQPIPLKVRSLVGLIPLYAVETLEPELIAKVPEFKERLEWLMANRPELANLVSRWQDPGKGDRRLLSLLRGHRMKRLLRRMLDENEFLSPYGIRALSKFHEANPYEFRVSDQSFSVKYTPAESDTTIFGGNSNWRGPIWFPTNFLIIESLQKFHHYYGNDFTVECPTGSGNFMTLAQVAEEISNRLCKLFLRDGKGRRAVFGDDEMLQTDPNFKDYVLFYEYFHGDSGRGVGASHQTGWTGLVAKLLQPKSKHAPPIG